MLSNKLNPYFHVLLAASLFGASTPLAKLMLGKIDAVVLASFLYLGSGLGVILLLAARRIFGVQSSEAGISRADLFWLVGAIITGGVAAPIIVLFSLKNTPAATASLLLNFEAVATILIAMLVFKEAVGKRIGFAIGFVTLASLLLTWKTNEDWVFSLGALGIILACILWGLDNNFTRNISAKNPLTIVAIKGIGAGIFSLILAVVMGRPLPGYSSMLLAMLLGFVCYGLSIVLFILAMRNLGAARTSTLFGIAPFIGMLLSVLIFRETATPLFYVSIPVMLLGAWLMLTEQHHHQHLHLRLEHEHAHFHQDGHHNHDNGDLVDGREEHTHWHTHKEIIHSHPHNPDLHHRHQHPHD